jgi:nucleoside-diphosphate-sugar epimerase
MSFEPIDLSKVKTLVFGANGFLGSAIANTLSLSGRNVIAVIRPDASRNQLLENSKLRIIRMAPNLWPKLLADVKPTHVICTQWSGVQKSLRGDVNVQESNLTPIIELAEVTKSLSINTFIALGSQAESIESASLITEEISRSGTSPYGKAKSKLCSELSSIFEDSYTRFIWARVFSVYGPSDKSDSILMELHKSELEGVKLNVNNPNTLWSFLYEDDFADAVKRILESVNVSGVINIANPQLVEIQRIVDTWLGSSHNSSEGNENNTVKQGFFPMVGKLMSLGWAPEVSLEEGIQRTREAYRRSFNSNY